LLEDADFFGGDEGRWPATGGRLIEEALVFRGAGEGRWPAPTPEKPLRERSMA